MLLLSKFKFYTFVFIVIITSITSIFFVSKSFFKQKEIISRLEHNNEITIDYFNKRESLNKNIYNITKDIMEDKNINGIDRFNHLNDCLFSVNICGKGSFK